MTGSQQEDAFEITVHFCRQPWFSGVAKHILKMVLSSHEEEMSYSQQKLHKQNFFNG